MPKEKVVFRLRHSSLTNSKNPAMVDKIIKFLLKQRLGYIWSTYDLAVEMGVSERSLQRHQRHPALLDFWDHGTIDDIRTAKHEIAIWGSKKTIQAHRENQDADNNA